MSDINARFDQINTPEYAKNIVEEAREFMRSALGDSALYLGFLQRASETSALWEHQTAEQHTLVGINLVGNALILAHQRRDTAGQFAPAQASIVVENGTAKVVYRPNVVRAEDFVMTAPSAVESFGAKFLAATGLIRLDSIQPPDSVVELAPDTLQAA